MRTGAHKCEHGISAFPGGKGALKAINILNRMEGIPLGSLGLAKGRNGKNPEADVA